ncbi:DNA-binding response regulator [Aliidiomarina minuta]|uniref:DNA-binding response regulator n=1 Tax=Aliidiomarina minuta TaxID=880057 RepID=A0A432W3G1_9GAMM|nr:response regulator transcription factor [Aliidiomarina minuta]RUO23905.1 DNA-binding response regulator [Aliidiomarina minuta]
MANILLIDDDVDLGSMLREYLARDGMQLTTAEDGEEGLEVASDGEFDLILLDIMLPKIDGLQLLKKLRQREVNTSVIMLTARGEDVDRVVGLELGADDYLAKPFYPRELVARIKALLRRSRTSNTVPTEEKLHFAGFVMDSAAAEVNCDQQSLVLTPTEFDILRCLLTHHGQLVTKESLSNLALGRQLGPFDRSLDVHISNIRKKLPNRPERIQTVRGRGYRVAEEA